MMKDILTGINYLNLTLYIVAGVLSLAVLILLFRRFRLSFLVWLIVSAVMVLTYTAITYWLHYLPPKSSSAASTYAAYFIYSGACIANIIGLVGCIRYLRTWNNDPRTNASTIRR